MSLLKKLLAEVNSASSTAESLTEQIGWLRQQIHDLNRLTARLDEAEAPVAPPAVDYSAGPDPEPTPEVEMVPMRIRRKSSGTRYAVDPKAPIRTATSPEGLQGIAANQWWWREFQDVIPAQFKPALGLAGYLQRVIQHGRAQYDVTPLGHGYFFTYPYERCPSMPELWITPRGQQLVRDLYRANRLPRRGNR